MNLNPFHKEKTESLNDNIVTGDYEKFIELKKKAVEDLLQREELIKKSFEEQISALQSRLKSELDGIAEKLEEFGHSKKIRKSIAGKRIRRSFPVKSSDEIKAELASILEDGAKSKPEILKAMNIPASRLKEFIDSGFLKFEGERRGRKYSLK
jgi:hypothetical protein